MISTLSNKETEAKIFDVLSMLIKYWRHFLISTILGIFLGFGAWGFFGSYSAQYVLLNSDNSYGLDLVSWKTIQKSLPNLAAQIESDGVAIGGDDAFLKNLTSERWWQKNVVAGYAISKADAKDLAGLGKDLDAATTTIVNITITSDGRDKKTAINDVNTTANFLSTGGAYLQLRSILRGYEGDVVSSAAEIRKKLSRAEVEKSYQIKRVQGLENLHKRFPASATNNQQVVDPKESGAKYLPISTQIIAVNNEINQSNEIIQRLNDRLEQLALIEEFLKKARPMIAKTYDGLILGNQLLQLEGEFRGKLANDDIKSREILDQLRAQLSEVQARFTSGLEAGTAPAARKTGVLFWLLAGALFGIISMAGILIKDYFKKYFFAKI